MRTQVSFPGSQAGGWLREPEDSSDKFVGPTCMGRGSEHKSEPCEKEEAIKMPSGRPAVPYGTH